MSRRGVGLSVVEPGNDNAGSLHYVSDCRPDVLILDIRLPGLDGTEIKAKLDRLFPLLGVILLTGYDHPVYVNALSELGVGSYLAKAVPRDEVLAVVRSTLDQHSLLSSENVAPREGVPGQRLTICESEVLHLLASGRRYADAARELGISTKTVEGHVRQILDKLGAQSLVQAVLELRRLAAAQRQRQGRSDAA